MKQVIAILLCFIICLFPVSAFAEFSDVPNAHWAEKIIEQAVTEGIITGIGEDMFGLGQYVKRCEFAAMLVRLMRWETIVLQESYFSDVAVDAWYFSAVETLCANGAVDAGGNFRPEENITREEMAVMLVRSLDYQQLAEQVSRTSFVDVTEYTGYIALAHEFGIINGKSDETFAPYDYALREEAAAMLMRLCNKTKQSIQWLHGFYAISSWSQREMAAQMDAVSFGWSRLEYGAYGVTLNQTSDNGNDWNVPEGAADAISYLKENNVKLNLAVMMNTSMEVILPDGTISNACEVILTDARNRSAAVSQIADAARMYDGVTIDFEGMSGSAMRDGLNEFLKKLRMTIGDKLLYTAIHPVADGGYFDAYDYRRIGEVSDKVILMAHDYAALRMEDNLRKMGFCTTPVTPIKSIYTALCAVTDAENGVEDRDKIVLALSLSSTAAWLLQNGVVINEYAVHPSPETVHMRLQQADTKITYNRIYCNPNAEYFDDDGNRVSLWYEDSRSVLDKIQLARMFGIYQLSVWRLGVIPNDTANEALHYDVWRTILSQRNK